MIGAYKLHAILSYGVTVIYFFYVTVLSQNPISQNTINSYFQTYFWIQLLLPLLTALMHGVLTARLNIHHRNLAKKGDRL